MIPPIPPQNEAERLHALRALRILDTPHEERFDRVTRLAKRLFGVSISLVSLVDEGRQWFKSAQGLDASETPREVSFCGHAIHENELFIIPNALEDERFHDNPLVLEAPHIRFYAAYPLKIREGLNIGTLCLIDQEPREMSEEDQQLLSDLGSMIEEEIKSIQMATLDELTFISNRRGFMTLAAHCIKVCKRDEHTLTFLMFDLNKFKAINDTYGHHEGDEVLVTFAQALLNTFRESDVIGRLGGDEFVALLSDTAEECVDQVLARFSASIDEINQTMYKSYNIEYSVGIKHFSHDAIETTDEMLKAADSAMYINKKAGSDSSAP